MGEEGETMELHQGCCQIYTAETAQQKIQDKLLKQMMKERKISNLQRGIVKSRKSSMDINFPDTPPATPYRDNYIPHPPDTPRETSFLFLEGSLSLL